MHAFCSLLIFITLTRNLKAFMECSVCGGHPVFMKCPVCGRAYVSIYMCMVARQGLDIVSNTEQLWRSSCATAAG